MRLSTGSLISEVSPRKTTLPTPTLGRFRVVSTNHGTLWDLWAGLNKAGPFARCNRGDLTLA